MTPTEVAALFGVDPRTVFRWGTATRTRPALIKCIYTPGGKRRYQRDSVQRLYDESQTRGHNGKRASDNGGGG
jgi:predicted site-specific integrase-resolvase